MNLEAALMAGGLTLAIVFVAFVISHFERSRCLRPAAPWKWYRSDLEGRGERWLYLRSLGADRAVLGAEVEFIPSTESGGAAYWHVEVMMTASLPVPLRVTYEFQTGTCARAKKLAEAFTPLDPDMESVCGRAAYALKD